MSSWLHRYRWNGNLTFISVDCRPNPVSSTHFCRSGRGLGVRESAAAAPQDHDSSGTHGSSHLPGAARKLHCQGSPLVGFIGKFFIVHCCQDTVARVENSKNGEEVPVRLSHFWPVSLPISPFGRACHIISLPRCVRRVRSRRSCRLNNRFSPDSAFSTPSSRYESTLPASPCV